MPKVHTRPDPEISQASPDPSAIEGKLAELQTDEIVARIAADDKRTMAQLYATIRRRYLYRFLHRLGPEEAWDCVHSTWLIVVQRIKSGRIRDPARIWGYIATVARRQECTAVRKAVLSRQLKVMPEDVALCHPGPDPELQVVRAEQVEVMVEQLRSMRPLDQEILIRFYLQGQPPQQICREMGLSHTQFRLRKSRAKSQLASLVTKHAGRYALRKAIRAIREANGYCVACYSTAAP